MGAVLLICVTFAVYAPVFDTGFIWDDDSYVTKNPTLRSLEGLGQIWFEPTATPQYYPLVFTGFWLEYQLWGLNPLGYHLVNILIHAVSAVLVWRILGSLQVPGAWLAAVIFALHPVHVESVAWITERKNVLSGLFYLLSMGGMLTYFGLRGSDEDGQKKQGGMASGFFFSSALC